MSVGVLGRAEILGGRELKWVEDNCRGRYFDCLCEVDDCDDTDGDSQKCTKCSKLVVTMVMMMIMPRFDYNKTKQYIAHAQHFGAPRRPSLDTIFLLQCAKGTSSLLVSSSQQQVKLNGNCKNIPFVRVSNSGIPQSTLAINLEEAKP